ncbi:hypothetical protein [Corallincola spongiicola]|uniref:Uncharacterized protein n=1 Tax=Corallincola spongiicola TaxID=2520508 RepID=A0ABY1WRV1_9GAMM|nr:hypothetical protein [Corallincola spongiicola]TAA47254.1 hypothetical protein EXY25_08435 [Corallincola spongiicola]
MRYIPVLILILISSAAFSAALVVPVSTRVDTSGVLGDPDVPVRINYRIVAELKDAQNTFRDNKQIIKALSITIGEAKLSIPNGEIDDLESVALEQIYITYTHNFVGESWVELFIPYGPSKSCTNHENVTSIRSSKKILRFNMQGKFLKSKRVVPCHH